MKQETIPNSTQARVVTNSEEALSALETGARNRYARQLRKKWRFSKVRQTTMNRQSSRSHSVFTLCITSVTTEDGISRKKIARLRLIDLAGSERPESEEAEQRKESCNINSSLLTLGRVIRALADGENSSAIYRDSKLTHLLKVTRPWCIVSSSRTLWVVIARLLSLRPFLRPKSIGVRLYPPWTSLRVPNELKMKRSSTNTRRLKLTTRYRKKSRGWTKRRGMHEQWLIWNLKEPSEDDRKLDERKQQTKISFESKEGGGRGEDYSTSRAANERRQRDSRHRAVE